MVTQFVLLCASDARLEHVPLLMILFATTKQAPNERNNNNNTYYIIYYNKMTSPTTVHEQIDQLVEKWLEQDPFEDTRQEITSLHQSGQYDQLDKQLRNRIAFGTAGTEMNLITVIIIDQCC